jgi:hypothetical protein
VLFRKSTALEIRKWTLDPFLFLLPFRWGPRTCSVIQKTGKHCFPEDSEKKPKVTERALRPFGENEKRCILTISTGFWESSGLRNPVSRSAEFFYAASARLQRIFYLTFFGIKFGCIFWGFLVFLFVFEN